MKLSRTQLLLGLALLVAAGLFLWRASRAIPAEVVRAETRDVVEVVVASGRLRAVRQSGVGAEVGGLVDGLEAREGDRVVAGQLLGRLRVSEVSAQLGEQRSAVVTAERSLRREQVTLAQARSDLARAEALALRKLIADDAVERARTAVRDGEAAVAVATARVEEAGAALRRSSPEFAKREVRAPFAGIVVARLVEPGRAVTAGQEWFQVAEMSNTELYVETDENNLGRLRVGQPAIAVAPAFPTESFPATLSQIGPNVDSDRGVVGLRLSPTSLPEFALPNMTVDVSIEVNRLTAAMALPVTALARDRAGDFVLVVGDDGRLVRQAVEIVGRNPGVAAVKGLPDGAVLVRDPRAFEAGTRIEPLTPAVAPGGQG
jgi:HlyD family secretion protein